MFTLWAELSKHNLWANLRLFDACATLPDATLDTGIAGTFGTIRQTLAHIVSSEESYTARLTGYDQPPPLPDTPGIAEMRERSQRSGEALIAFAVVDDDDRSLLFDDGTYAASVSIVLTQVLNHATDHRSQICTTLAQLGVEPPDLQGWGYNDALAKDRLLASLRESRAEWETLLEEAGTERLTEPGVAGDWSVKDLLGHLTAFHRVWGARVRGAVTGVPPTFKDLYDVDEFPPGAATWTVDEENAAIHDHYAPFPLPDVLAKWREATDLLTESVAALTGEDIIFSNRFPWTNGKPLAEAIAGDTYAHADEHAEEVRARLKGGLRTEDPVVVEG